MSTNPVYAIPIHNHNRTEIGRLKSINKSKENTRILSSISSSTANALTFFDNPTIINVKYLVTLFINGKCKRAPFTSYKPVKILLIEKDLFNLISFKLVQLVENIR